MPANIRLEDVLSALAANIVAGIHTVAIGRVLSYDDVASLADVQPVTKRRFEDADTGAVTYEERPAIPMVPVCWPQGGGFGMSLPLAAGDHVILLFAQESVSSWRENGQAEEPIDAGRLTDSHPIALPGAFSKGNAFPGTGASGAFLGHGATGTGVDVTASSVGVGLSAARTGVATAQTTAAFFTTLNAFATAAAAFATACAAHGNDPLLGAALPTGVTMATAATAMGTAASALIPTSVPSLPANFSSSVKASP